MFKRVTYILFLKKPVNLNEEKELLVPLLVDIAIAVSDVIILSHFELINKKDEKYFGSYVHLNGKLAFIVVIKKNKEQIINNLVMYIIINNPSNIKLDDITKEIFKNKKKFLKL